MSAHSSIDLGSNYERLTGNCTRIVAEEIARTISPPITTSSFVLDNACGPGIVTEQIKLLYPDAKILASDIAPVMIEQVKERIEREAWTDVEAVIMDGRDLSGLKDESVPCDHGLWNAGSRRRRGWCEDGESHVPSLESGRSRDVCELGWYV